MAVHQREISFEDMTFIDPKYPNVRVDLEWIGEGVSGEFNPENPNDEPLLRFTVYRRDEEGDCWDQVAQASYCTNLPATAPKAILAQVIKRIHDEVAEEVQEDNSVKRICENLSHISLEWFKDDHISLNYAQKCSETIADIALTAGYMLAKGEIQIDDSREFISQVVKWAEDFNIIHLDNDWDNISYIEAVDEYGKTLLLEHYGNGEESERGSIEVSFSDENLSEENPGWDIDVFDKGGDRIESLTKCGVKNLLEINEYLEELRQKYDVSILQQQHFPTYFIKDCWAVKDEKCGYGDTFEILSDALSKHEEGDLLKGFCIKDERDVLAETITFWKTRDEALFEVAVNLKGIVI